MSLLLMPGSSPVCRLVLLAFWLSKLRATFGASNAASSSSNDSNVIGNRVTSTPSTSNTLRLGDFIASGIGMADAQTVTPFSPLTPSVTASPSGTSVSYSSYSIDSAVYNTSHLGLSQTLSAANDSASGHIGNHTSTSNGSTTTNASLALCYDEWMTYWSDSSSYGASNTVTVWPVSSTTIWYNLTTATAGYTIDVGTFTYSRGVTYTQTLMAGAFSYMVETETYAGVQTVTQAASTYATAETWTENSEFYSTATVPDVLTITPPPCALPSVVPECQSSWMSYYSASTAVEPPLCQNIAMDGKLCNSFRDKFVVDNKWQDSAQFDGYSKGYIFNSSYSGDMTASNAWIWPTWSALAPSCTLGCARCGITGGFVQLLYWPPNTSYHTATGPITAAVDNITLTYPTVYVSYHAVSASDSCSAVGPTFTNTIVAIPNSADISSIYAQPMEGARFGIVGDDIVTTNVASFNLADLQDTPDSVFSRQIWCVSLLSQHADVYSDGTFYNEVGEDNMGLATLDYSCPTTLPYNPVLYLPSQIIQSMYSGWASCSGDINGVYDPPTALTPRGTAAGPTTPQVLTLTPTPASPSSTRLAPTPSTTMSATTGQATAAPASDLAGDSSEASQASNTSASGQVDPAVSTAADPKQSSSVNSISTQDEDSSSQISDDFPATTLSVASFSIDPTMLMSLAGNSATGSTEGAGSPTTSIIPYTGDACNPTVLWWLTASFVALALAVSWL
ncbi:hypothetical protein LTR15_009391 [Elasticomyces elasticus]|nr:hypothetical protein LTR15_009391 [Elasticomyces elasticus]